MTRWMLGLLAVLFSATLAVAQQQPTTPATPQHGDIPQIVAFDNDGLLGDHIHIFGTKVELGPGLYLHIKDHGIKDNSISSIRLVSPLTAREPVPLVP